MKNVLDGLDVEASAARVPISRLDHFPPLSMYFCLKDAAQQVARHVRAQSSNVSAISETLSMPKKGFGPRPVDILAPATRVLYTSLVDEISADLPAQTRQPGAWKKHREFGISESSPYVIDIDFASCYEYIDHELLRSELLLRTARPLEVNLLIGQLRSVSELHRGLPQMLRASDILADAYLSKIDRHIERAGHQIHRFADDIRVSADDWDIANGVIENTAEYARTLGLILAGGKTRIWKLATLVAASEAQQTYFQDYFNQARSELTQSIYRFTNDYDIVETEIPPERIDAIAHACWGLLKDWQEITSQSDGPTQAPQEMTAFLGTAIRALQKYETRISARALSDIVFHNPLRLEDACRYLIARANSEEFEHELHWVTLRKLVQMGRQSPWAKLWLIYTIDHLPQSSGEAANEVLTWLGDQVQDRHEVVRCQASWALAGAERLDDKMLSRLYTRSTELTRAGLAAAMGRGTKISTGVSKSIRDDSPLNKAAFEWATR